MAHEVHSVDPSLTAPDVLARAAESSVEGAVAVTSMASSCGLDELPAWLSLNAAASLLGLSALHVRLLGRDGKVLLRSTRDGVEVETASVLSRLPDTIRSREIFARHAAHPDELVASAVASLSE